VFFRFETTISNLNKVGFSESKFFKLFFDTRYNSHMNDYYDIYNNNISDSISDYESVVLPIVKSIYPKTIAQDINGFVRKEEIDSVKSRITRENRGSKIESIIHDKPFKEKKLEEDREYQDLMKRGVTPMSNPTGKLFYLDYIV